MKRLKRLVSMFLMLTMIVTGLNLDGFVLEVKAEPVEEATYLGMMLTKEEYQTLAYGKGTEDGDWYSFAYVDNRYKTERSTVNEVLSDLKARENFFRTADEENYNSEHVAINSYYYLVIAMSADRTAQTVTELDGTKGVVFGADCYKEEDSVPEEEANWLSYTYGNLTVDVEAPVAFARGCFSDITLNYVVDAAVSVNEAHIAGTIEGQTSNESVKSLYIGRDVRAYGLCGFDSERFFVQTGTDENDNIWKNAGMRFDSQTGEEPISFGEISCAVIKEDGTVTPAEDNADKSWISLDILYHEGYVPTFTGASDLGTSGEEENAWDNTIGLSYFESMNESEDWVRHEPQAGEQAVVYANANAWKNSRVCYNGTENSWNYQIDADGTLFDVEQASYFVERYNSEADYYGDYHSEGDWMADGLASSGSIAGVMQMLAYDSELNADDAYYKLNLDYRYEENADTVGEITIGTLDIPAGVKGLRLGASGIEINGEFMHTVGVIDSIVVQKGTQLEMTGAYKGTDGCIEIGGNGEVSLWDVPRMDGDLLLTEDSVLSVASSTVAGKLGTSPADGTIGTLKLINWNQVGGIDSFKTVEYSEASITVKDNQGLVFYDITNGYDGSDAETAKGNLNITIEGAPTEETVPQFNKAVSPLGRRLDMAYDKNENGYPVYTYEEEEMWSRYAKVGDTFYLINEDNNHFDTTTSEQATGDVLTALRGQEPNSFDCDIQLNYVQSMDAEEWRNVEFSEGDKVLKVPADNAAIAGNIYENVHYYNEYGLEKDIDGSLLSRELDNGIHVWIYQDDPKNEENTAGVAFENDYEREGWAYSEEVAYTSSGELANLWMEYLAEVKGEQYLRLTTNADNETDFGNLKLPASALGLGIYTEMNWDIQPATYKQASIDSVTATADGQIVKIKGSYSKGFDFNKGGSNAILQLTGARVHGEVNAREAEVTTCQETVVSSLKNMKTLNLEGNLTIENEMKFAADGQLNVTEPDVDGRLLAKAGASIELPDVNLIYNAEGKNGNRMEIYEEIKDGMRPTISVTGEIATGIFWDYRNLNLYYNDGENEYGRDLLCHVYYYEPAEGERIDDLIELNGKIYQIEGDRNSDTEGITEIELDDITWKIRDVKLIDKSGEYTLEKLQQNKWDNMVSLIPYDYSKIEDGADLLADMYTADNYCINVWDGWNATYDATEEVQEYYLSDAAVNDINFQKLVVQYGYEGEEFFPRCVEVYPVQQYLLTKDAEDTTFTEEDAYEDIGMRRKYAMYSRNYAEPLEDGDNGVRTSSHYIAALIPGMAEVDLADTDKISIQTKQHTYTGSAIEEKPVITYISGEGAEPYVLQEGTDYTLSYSDNTDAGQATITVTAVENSGFTGSTTATFTIAKKALDKSMVAAIAGQTYTGAALTPAVVVKDGTETLVKDTDYTVSYQNNTNVGTATVTITAKEDSNYSGTLSTSFAIAKKALDKSMVAAIASQTYTGAALTPAVVVKDGAKTLVKDTDYTVSYQNNTNAGTATVTITAKGNYSGSVATNFAIAAKSVAGLTVKGITTKYYTGKAIKPAITVYDGSVKLTTNDYMVSYSKNTNIGKSAVVKITGKGNYTGTLTKNFTITVKKNASYTVGSYKYKITNAATTGKGTVTVTGPAKTTIKTVKITDTVTIGGVKFKITAIEKNAFKNCKKVTSVTIGNNVTSIGANAFYNCTALTKVTIGKAVKTIGQSAFWGDKKLKTITINTVSLKSVGKSALKGISAKAKIKVPSKKLTAYQKLLKGKGQASSVEIKK